MSSILQEVVIDLPANVLDIVEILEEVSYRSQLIEAKINDNYNTFTMKFLKEIDND